MLADGEQAAPGLSFLVEPMRNLEIWMWGEAEIVIGRVPADKLLCTSEKQQIRGGQDSPAETQSQNQTKRHDGRKGWGRGTVSGQKGNKGSEGENNQNVLYKCVKLSKERDTAVVIRHTVRRVEC